ncbi:uncharacterized protein LOC114290858 isoform X1 [Camellia sinensis]|uniref:uncharacterized protein LOC114290858 isoform X1 n=1 Tax=Camellia sinensis TaxID=4442 RepID=UPI0010365E05|nr:uncharacterized protein LOC114290858 isoform X1 [Camellia sinensis]
MSQYFQSLIPRNNPILLPYTNNHNPKPFNTIQTFQSHSLSFSLFLPKLPNNARTRLHSLHHHHHPHRSFHSRRPKTTHFILETLILCIFSLTLLSLRLASTVLLPDFPRRWHQLIAFSEDAESKFISHYYPSHLWQALVAYEDRRFFQHFGIDPVGIARAVFSFSARGGGSTITQQLVKNTFMKNERTFLRKIVEIVLALALERTLSKLKILGSYLSKELATGKMIGSGRAQSGLYFLDAIPASTLSSRALQCTFGSSLCFLHQWHRRLRHPSFSILEKLFPSLVRDCPRNNFVCGACKLAKHKRTCYPSINKRSTFPFMLIHTDVWGHSPVVSTCCYWWFVMFIDCFSRVTWIYLLRTKNEVFLCFKLFHKMVSNLFNATIKILRSDNGIEYVDGTFMAYLQEHGILYPISCVGTP